MRGQQLRRHRLPLLEREGELAAIDEMLDDGGLVVVEGRPGLGKSRLADGAAERAEATGFRVLSAAGQEGEQQFAFGVVLQLLERAARVADLDGAARLAAPLFARPGLRTVDESSLLPTLHGLYWLVVELAEEQPVLLVVDDGQWADEPSLRFLSYLAGRLDDLPVALLVLTRPGGLPALAAHPAAVVRSLSPLSALAVDEAVRDVLDEGADPALSAACADVSGGDPFLLDELLAALATAGPSVSVDRVRELTPDALTRRIVARLAALEPDAVELARALAVLRESYQPLHQAARVAGLCL